MTVIKKDNDKESIEKKGSNTSKKVNAKKLVKIIVGVLFVALFVFLVVQNTLQANEIDKKFQMHGSYWVENTTGLTTVHVVINTFENEYYVYRQGKMLDKGSYDENEIEKNLSVLTLTSSSGKNSSQIVWHRDMVFLIGFKDEVITLHNFSDIMTFLGVKSDAEVDVDQWENSSDEG